MKKGGFKAGVIRADIEIDDERRVLVIGTLDVEMRLKKLRSSRRLGYGLGMIARMVDFKHYLVEKIKFTEVGRCRNGDILAYRETVHNQLEAEGFIVYRRGTRTAREWVFYERKHEDWIDEGLKAIEGGVTVERMVGVLRALIRMEQVFQEKKAKVIEYEGVDGVPGGE